MILPSKQLFVASVCMALAIVASLFVFTRRTDTIEMEKTVTSGLPHKSTIEQQVRDASNAVAETGDYSRCHEFPVDQEVITSNAQHDWVFPRRGCYEIVLQRTQDPDVCADRYHSEPGDPEQWWIDLKIDECHALYGALSDDADACMRVTDPELREKCLFEVEGIESVPDASRKNVIVHPDVRGDFFLIIDGNLVSVRVKASGDFETIPYVDADQPVIAFAVNPSGTGIAYLTRDIATDEVEPYFAPIRAGKLGFLDLSTGARRELFDVASTESKEPIMGAPVFSADGKTVYFSTSVPWRVRTDGSDAYQYTGISLAPRGECRSAIAALDPSGRYAAIRYGCIEGSGTKIVDLTDRSLKADMYSYIEGQIFCGFIDGQKYAEATLGFDEGIYAYGNGFTELVVKDISTGATTDDVFTPSKDRANEIMGNGRFSDSCRAFLEAAGYAFKGPAEKHAGLESITLETDGRKNATLWFRDTSTNSLRRVLDFESMSEEAPYIETYFLSPR